MKTYLKTGLLASAGLLVLALPVAAGHQAVNLRGMIPTAQSQYTGAQTGLSQSWQSEEVVTTYAQNSSPSYGGIDPCGPECVGGAPYETAQARPKFMTRALNKVGLRGFSNEGQVRYSKQAAQDFRTQRAPEFNLIGGTVRTNAAHTGDMLDWQENTTGKAVTLLANRANGLLDSNTLYVGAGIQGGFSYQNTNTDGQFPLLSRSSNTLSGTARNASTFAINNAALTFTSTFGDWTTLYLQPEYSETEYGLTESEFQLRKAFVVFGNLEKSPLYAAFGRKTIDFGNFDSYNAFTRNEGARYFNAVSDQPVLELGYFGHGFKLTASAISGEQQLQTAYAGKDNKVANFAANAEKEFLIGRKSAFTLGGGYLHDTTYRDNFAAYSTQDRQSGTAPANFIEYRNSAANAFAEFNSPLFDAMIEYTTTMEPWAGAIPQMADGTPFAAYLIDPMGSTTDIDNINFDEKLSTLVAQVRIKPMVKGRRLAIAAVGSWGNVGDDFQGVGATGQQTTWSKHQQHAVSLEYPISPFLEVGAEYVYNKGFSPLDATQLNSSDDTKAHAVNVGFKARF